MGVPIKFFHFKNPKLVVSTSGMMYSNGSRRRLLKTPCFKVCEGVHTFPLNPKPLIVNPRTRNLTSTLTMRSKLKDTQGLLRRVNAVDGLVKCHTWPLGLGHRTQDQWGLLRLGRCWLHHPTQTLPWAGGLEDDPLQSILRVHLLVRAVRGMVLTTWTMNNSLLMHTQIHCRSIPEISQYLLAISAITSLFWVKIPILRHWGRRSLSCRGLDGSRTVSTCRESGHQNSGRVW